MIIDNVRKQFYPADLESGLAGRSPPRLRRSRPTRCDVTSVTMDTFVVTYRRCRQHARSHDGGGDNKRRRSRSASSPLRIAGAQRSTSSKASSFARSRSSGSEICRWNSLEWARSTRPGEPFRRAAVEMAAAKLRLFISDDLALRLERDAVVVDVITVASFRRAAGGGLSRHRRKRPQCRTRGESD